MVKSQYFTVFPIDEAIQALYWTFNFVGGIFAGCEGNETPDHAVAVVGYGTYNGVDYWLIKVKSCNLPYGSLKPYCTNNQEQDI